MMPPDIPGFYYDEARKKYFKVINGAQTASSTVNKYHNNSVQAEKRRKVYREQERDPKGFRRNTQSKVSKQISAYNRLDIDRSRFSATFQGTLNLKTGKYRPLAHPNYNDMVDTRALRAKKITPSTPGLVAGHFGPYLVTQLSSNDPVRDFRLKLWDPDLSQWHFLGEEMIDFNTRGFVVDFDVNSPIVYDSCSESSSTGTSGFCIYSFVQDASIRVPGQKHDFLKFKHVEVKKGQAPHILDFTGDLLKAVLRARPKYNSRVQAVIDQIFGLGFVRINTLNHGKIESRRQLETEIDHINVSLAKTPLGSKNPLIESFLERYDSYNNHQPSYEYNFRPLLGGSVRQVISKVWVSDDNEILLVTSSLEVIKLKFVMESSTQIRFIGFWFAEFSYPLENANYRFKNMIVEHDYIHLTTYGQLITLKRKLIDKEVDQSSNRFCSVISKTPSLIGAFLLSPAKLLVLNRGNLVKVTVEENAHGAMVHRNLYQVIGSYFMENVANQLCFVHGNHLLVHEREGDFKLFNLSRCFDNGCNIANLGLNSPDFTSKNLIHIGAADGLFALYYTDSDQTDSQFVELSGIGA